MNNIASERNQTTCVTCKNGPDTFLKLKSTVVQQNNIELNLNDLKIDDELNDFFSKKDKKKNKKKKKKDAGLLILQFIVY